LDFVADHVHYPVIDRRHAASSELGVELELLGMPPIYIAPSSVYKMGFPFVHRIHLILWAGRSQRRRSLPLGGWDSMGRTTVRGIVLIIVILSACGDANTNDDRGYTKAPLENPNVLIKAEGSSAMDSLGSPILPRDTVISPPPAAAPPAAPAAQPK
jgi:hypothetical protein